MTDIRHIQSISELHRILGLPKPGHPLISVINVSHIGEFPSEIAEKVIYDFYLVCMKTKFEGTMRYGKNYYDFEEGILSFISPGQMLSTDAVAAEGWVLIFHPDFIQGDPLAKAIGNYGFFSYELSEGLFLSDKELQIMEGVLQQIKDEYHSQIDHHTRQIILSHIGVLLNYSERFYTRQFITRKAVNNDLLTRLEQLLHTYFESGQVEEAGLPTVEYIAQELHVSPSYLGDMLRVSTGQSTQQHIQNALIEKAKQALSTTALSVGEIAYQLGFKHPQSFNKLFKSKVNVSPLEFRRSFN